MKRILVAVTLMSFVGTAQAEPVFLHQAASFLKAKQLEVGVSAQAGYQKSEIENLPGTTFINRVWHFPLMARYAWSDALESRLLVPITRAVDSSEGTASSRSADTGLGNVQVGTKWNFASARIPLAFGVDIDLPTANSRNNPAALGWRYSTQVQQGFNTHAYFAADHTTPVDWLSLHANLGYMNTATYTTSTGSRFNPSDLMTFGASVEMDLAGGLKGLAASVEMVGNTALNHSKSGSTRNGSDKGTVLEVGPALRYDCGNWRTHAGLLLDEGKATFRAYNFRTVFGVSYVFGTAGK